MKPTLPCPAQTTLPGCEYLPAREVSEKLVDRVYAASRCPTAVPRRPSRGQRESERGNRPPCVAAHPLRVGYSCSARGVQADSTRLRKKSFQRKRRSHRHDSRDRRGAGDGFLRSRRPHHRSSHTLPLRRPPVSRILTDTNKLPVRSVRNTQAHALAQDRRPRFVRTSANIVAARAMLLP